MDSAYIIIQDPLSYKTYKLNHQSEVVKIEGLNFYFQQDWYCQLDNGLYFEDDTKIKKLNETIYLIKSEEVFYKRQLLVYTKSEGASSFAFYQEKDLFISDDLKADIQLLNPYFQNKYIYIKERILYSNYPFIYLNGHFYHEEKLQDGDELFCLGLSMIFLNDGLWMNRFLANIQLPKIKNSGLIYKGPAKVKDYELAYRKLEHLPSLKIDVLKKPDFKEDQHFNLFEQMAPSLTISFAMVAVSLLNAYLNFQRGRSLIEILPLLILPIVLFASSLIWPLLFKKLKKKAYLKEKSLKEKAYIVELEKAEEALLNQYATYYKIQKDNYFDRTFLYQHLKAKKFFYYHLEDPDFLNLSLGYQKWEKDLSFLDEKKSISKIESLYPKLPFFLDLKELQYCTILESIKEDHYFARRIILECLMKYHPKDVLLVFFKVQEDYFKVLSHPHFFYEEMRYFLEDENELQSLEAINNREIIIFSFAKINYSQLSKNMHFIYFSQKEIQRFSEVVIDVKNGKGSYLKEGKQISFEYPIEDLKFTETAQELMYYLPFNHDRQTVFGLKEAFKVNDLKEIFLKKDKRDQLQAPIARIHDDVFWLNLSESTHGPHGLIAGSTGSGKTELIVSILASFALLYSPFELGFILIDFKGGMIAERLSYKGQRIPHIYAEISNLNEDVKRFLVALNKECQKRQILFQKCSQKLLKPIMDLEDYKKFATDEFENLADLIIVVDEFAELKRLKPDFLKELISLARIGRSLGIHLILSTQKPSGVIDDEIWANCRFKIALKVQDEKDSKEVIKKADAAYLKKPGQFYCLVDQNCFYAESLYTRLPLLDEDFKIALLDEQFKKKKEFKNKGIDETELDELLKTLVQLEKPKVNFLLEKPRRLNMKELYTKYHLQNDWIIGEYDDYENQKVGPVMIDEEKGPILVIGQKMESFMNLYRKYRQLVVVGESDFRHPCLKDHFSYADNDYEYLYECLSKQRYHDFVLVYENLSELFAYKEEYIYLFQKMLNQFQDLSVVAFVKNIHAIPARIIQMFHTKIYFGNDSNSYFSIYDESCTMVGDAYVNLDNVLPFILAISSPLYRRIRFKPLLSHIPLKRTKKLENDQILVAYNAKTRQEVFLDLKGHYVVTSLHDDLLKAFKTLFNEDCFEVINYRDLKKDYYDELIFLGPGVFHQTLFYIKGNEDLLEDEGIYLKNGQLEKLKMVNHE